MLSKIIKKQELNNIIHSLKYLHINYINKKDREVPTLRQICCEKISNITNIMIIPFLELDKKLKQIGLSINQKRIKNINIKIEQEQEIKSATDVFDYFKNEINSTDLQNLQPSTSKYKPSSPKM